MEKAGNHLLGCRLALWGPVQAYFLRTLMILGLAASVFGSLSVRIPSPIAAYRQGAIEDGDAEILGFHPREGRLGARSIPQQGRQRSRSRHLIRLECEGRAAGAERANGGKIR